MKTVGYSPKAIWATVVSGGIGIVLALLTLFQDQPELLAPLPPVVQALALALIPGLATWVAAYKADPGIVVEDSNQDVR